MSEERHEDLRQRLFDAPECSAEGWEPARTAQARMVAATDHFLCHAPLGDLAIVGHGGVGAFLWCALAGREISLDADQQRAGSVFAFDRESRAPIFSWREIEAV